LEKVVYDGYEYYLQSFVEKKTLADDKNPFASPRRVPKADNLQSTATMSRN